ncbi:MAG: hypothetical protein FWB85_07940 [Chitinispirillia bacterium]|nr:hypothetical protein [Chitinispirillia bacterium]MCL2242221.1 hypothetical protein [Chitinispirillia bacterium]
MAWIEYFDNVEYCGYINTANISEIYVSGTKLIVRSNAGVKTTIASYKTQDEAVDGLTEYIAHIIDVDCEMAALGVESTAKALMDVKERNWIRPE